MPQEREAAAWIRSRPTVNCYRSLPGLTERGDDEVVISGVLLMDYALGDGRWAADAVRRSPILGEEPHYCLDTAWFTVGGVFDIIYLFRQLRIRAADPSDDGRVETIDPAVEEKLQ